MTCIVAIEKDGSVFMGGDSASVGGWDKRICTEPKVFKTRGFIIGYTSSFRMGQLLQYGLDLPERSIIDPGTDMDYLVTGFIPAARKCLTDGGYTRIANNEESGGQFLVGYLGKVYNVDSDFQISHTGDINACGCGQNYAMGALEVLDKSKPEEAILRALEIAGKYSTGVSAPYYVDNL